MCLYHLRRFAFLKDVAKFISQGRASLIFNKHSIFMAPGSAVANVSSQDV